jgi:hypothetical protein
MLTDTKLRNLKPQDKLLSLVVSMAHNPDLIVGAANDWWARNTSIPTIQGQALDMWGRLFSLPVVRAINQ